jgi:uncharacterized protein YbcI
MMAQNPTRGQIERTLSQRIQALYRERTGHRPGKVTCQFFDEKLAIILEQIATPIERLLIERQQLNFAQELHSKLEYMMRSEVTELIEEIAEVSVICLLSDTDLTCDCSSFTAILQDTPPVRDPASIPKVRKEKVLERSTPPDSED